MFHNHQHTDAGELLASTILSCDASFEHKMVLLTSIEPTIELLYQAGKTSVKPIFAMTEDDLTH